jgi:hypothetical protein
MWLSVVWSWLRSLWDVRACEPSSHRSRPPLSRGCSRRPAQERQRRIHRGGVGREADGVGIDGEASLHAGRRRSPLSAEARGRHLVGGGVRFRRPWCWDVLAGRLGQHARCVQVCSLLVGDVSYASRRLMVRRLCLGVEQGVRSDWTRADEAVRAGARTQATAAVGRGIRLRARSDHRARMRDQRVGFGARPTSIVRQPVARDRASSPRVASVGHGRPTRFPRATRTSRASVTASLRWLRT